MKAWGSWETVLLGLLAATLVTFSLTIDGFLSPFALADSTYNFYEKAIVVLAMAMLIIAREIDLSVAAIMALASLAMGIVMQAGGGALLMVAAALLTGVACGALNGWLVTGLGLPSIVVTIGTLSLFRGVALVLLADQAITGYPELFITLGNGTLADLIPALPWLVIPYGFLIMLIMAVAVCVFFHHTVHGRRIYAIGANPIAAQFSGVAVDRYRFWLFVFAGLMAAVAAILLTGRIGSTRPNLAMGWELDIITMVILGGICINGGKGSVVGAMLAAVLIGVFTFGLGMLNVKGIVMSLIMGALLIAAMVLPRYLPMRKTRPAP